MSTDDHDPGDGLEQAPDDPDDDRDEPSGGERITRNWDELLQELRVTQTGVQILTGFLLTVPFSQRFTQLDTHQKAAYVVVLVACVCATALLIAPVAFHRALFRRRQRPWLVRAGHRCAVAGLTMLAIASCGVVYVVTDFVLPPWASLVITAGLAVLFGGLWLGVPLADVVGRRRK